jgi:23S rRNA (adenine2030-N6)-methyltransferase
LFELHPNRFQVAHWQHRAVRRRQVVVAREDGFEALKTAAAGTRAMVLCEPKLRNEERLCPRGRLSRRTPSLFATGTHAVWYPIIPRLRHADPPRS